MLLGILFPVNWPTSCHRYHSPLKSDRGLSHPVHSSNWSQRGEGPQYEAHWQWKGPEVVPYKGKKDWGFKHSYDPSVKEKKNSEAAGIPGPVPNQVLGFNTSETVGQVGALFLDPHQTLKGFKSLLYDYPFKIWPHGCPKIYYLPNCSMSWVMTVS